MKKYNTDKEIGDMLTQASNTLSPNEVAFSNMLSVLDTRETPSISPYSVKKSLAFNYSLLSSSTMRIASGFAVFVFVLVGMFGLKSKSLDTVTAPEVASTQETQTATLAVNSEGGDLKPSIMASTANTQTKSTLAVASLKSSTAAPEAVDLQNALVDELNAEITAQADLLALSDNI